MSQNNPRPPWSSRKAVSIRGLLVDNVWHCDCDPRLAAQHFQTKNGGKNHGRWFYTCPKPQRKGCSFFLWDDDAKRRAGVGEIPNNEKDKTNNASGLTGLERDGLRTPATNRMRDAMQTGLLTPETGMKRDNKRKWNDVDVDDLDDVFDGYESPSKKGKMYYHNQKSPYSTPRGPTSIRKSDIPNMNIDNSSHTLSNRFNDSLPSTQQSTSSSYLYPPAQPQSQHQPSYESSSFNTIAASPSTPTPARFTPAHLPPTNNSTPPPSHCQLATHVLSLLDSHQITVPPDAKGDLVKLLDTHDFRVKGISKGRDICRLAIKKREEQIQNLMGRIDDLETEKELWKASVLNKGKGGEF